MTPDLYQPRPLEVVTWDGTIERAADINTWSGVVFDHDDNGTGRYWDPINRVVVEVPVGWHVVKHPDGTLQVLSPDDLAAKYQPVPVTTTTTTPAAPTP